MARDSFPGADRHRCEATADQDGWPIIVDTGHYLASLLVLSIFLMAALAVLHQTVTAVRSALLVTCGKPVSLRAGAAFYPAYVPPAGIFAWIGGIPAHLVTAASGTERARPELPFPRLWSCRPRGQARAQHAQDRVPASGGQQ